MTRAEENKLIERTCKFDAYQSVWLWSACGSNAEQPDPNAARWYAHEKMMGHLEFLRKHEYRYCYLEGFIKNDGYYDRESEGIHTIAIKGNEGSEDHAERASNKDE